MSRTVAYLAAAGQHSTTLDLCFVTLDVTVCRDGGYTEPVTHWDFLQNIDNLLLVSCAGAAKIGVRTDLRRGRLPCVCKSVHACRVRLQRESEKLLSAPAPGV